MGFSGAHGGGQAQNMAQSMCLIGQVRINAFEAFSQLVLKLLIILVKLRFNTSVAKPVKLLKQCHFKILTMTSAEKW